MSFVDSGVQVPPQLEAAVWRCLEKDPDLRYQSVSDFNHAIEDMDHSAPPLDTTKSTMPTRRRWMSMGVAVLVVVVAVGLWLVRNQTAEKSVDLDPKMAVIAVFENRTGDPSLDALGTLVAEGIVEDASGIGD